MKKTTLTITTILGLVSAVLADTYVSGYYKKDGIYVAPHHRSDPNGTQYDNWSSKGNFNPYTGKEGTKTPTH